MKLAIIGDYNDNYRPHKATNESIRHSIEKFKISLQYDWISTDSVETDFKKIISTYKGVWIAPGSPYRSMKGAVKIIKYARENNIPTLGTCGGFQHMVIEFAKNVLGITITDKQSIIYKIFNCDTIEEKYYCNFGLNPEYQTEINKNGFKVVGSDTSNEARILELANHKFFIATLFVPQDNSTFDKPHQLIAEFLAVTCGQKSYTLHESVAQP